MPTGPRKQCKRFDVPGDAHHLTFSCFHGLPLLGRDRSRCWMIAAIVLARDRSPFDLWAYVIMPEHVHLVLLPGNDARISGILTTIKQSVAKRALLWLERNAPEFLEQLTDRQPNGESHRRFWQRGGGYDRNLRSLRDIHEKIRYIHENPVRRGLVEQAIDWQWSSTAAWETGGEGPVPIDRHSLPPLTAMDDDQGSSLMR